MGTESQNVGIMALVDAKLETVNQSMRILERDITEVSSTADEAKRLASKAHECVQLTLLNELRVEIGSWSKWWRGIMVTVLIGTVALAGWVVSIQAQRGKIDTLEMSVSNMESSVSAMRASQDDIVKKISAGEKKDGEREAIRVDVIKKALEEVLSKRDTRPRGGQRE